MRPVTILGPAPRFTGRPRRYVWCRSRELACTHGHRHRLQPFAIGVVGLTCTHREPPDSPPCGVSAAYIPFPEHGRTLAVEASTQELTALLIAGRSREEALEYLGVVVMPEVRPAA